MIESKRIDVPSFLYKKQYERKMNPLYMALTKEGVVFLIVAYFSFDILDGGIVWLIVSAISLKFIYKNHFHYKYYEFEKLWVVEKISNYINNRKNKTDFI